MQYIETNSCLLNRLTVGLSFVTLVLICDIVYHIMFRFHVLCLSSVTHFVC